LGFYGILEFTIGPEGRLAGEIVCRGSSAPENRDELRKTVSNLRFKPATGINRRVVLNLSPPTR
jgi:hypothetical protein